MPFLKFGWQKSGGNSFCFAVTAQYRRCVTTVRTPKRILFSFSVHITHNLWQSFISIDWLEFNLQQCYKQSRTCTQHSVAPLMSDNVPVHSSVSARQQCMFLLSYVSFTAISQLDRKLLHAASYDEVCWTKPGPDVDGVFFPAPDSIVSSGVGDRWRHSLPLVPLSAQKSQLEPLKYADLLSLNSRKYHTLKEYLLCSCV